MRVLVTGGTGFIGSHLVEALVRSGHEVSALARSPGKAEELGRLGARPVRGDLRRAEGLQRAVERQEVVFHVAGLVKARSEAEYLRVNRDGTRRLAQAAAGAGVQRLILVSSLSAAGPAEPGRRRADDEPPAPVTAYGRSKLAAESAARESGMPATIVRPPMVYGPRDVEVLRVFRMAARGVALVFGDGGQELSAIYVEDLVGALIAVAKCDAARGRTYCACHPELFTSGEFVRAVGRAVGREVRPLGLPANLVRAALSVTGAAAALAGRATLLNRDKANEFLAPAWTGDPAPLTRDTGWRAEVDLAAGLAATAVWYRRLGWVRKP